MVHYRLTTTNTPSLANSNGVKDVKWLANRQDKNSKTGPNHSTKELDLLADRIYDTLIGGTKTLAFFPAHLLEHLEADILTGKLELLIFAVVGLTTLLESLKVE